MAVLRTTPPLTQRLQSAASAALHIQIDDTRPRLPICPFVCHPIRHRASLVARRLSTRTLRLCRHRRFSCATRGRLNKPQSPRVLSRLPVTTNLIGAAPYRRFRPSAPPPPLQTAVYHRRASSTDEELKWSCVPRSHLTSCSLNCSRSRSQLVPPTLHYDHEPASAPIDIAVPSPVTAPRTPVPPRRRRHGLNFLSRFHQLPGLESSR